MRAANTLICPTCGCSLVRLGIHKENAILYRYEAEDYYFCCQGCVDLFITGPEKYLKELSDLIVCPTCLAEKPRHQALKFKIAGQDVHFCRCSHCAETFRKDPKFYIERLEGKIADHGVHGSEGCCIKPTQKPG